MTTTKTIKCVSNKTIMQMFPLSMLITLLFASSFIIPYTDGRFLPETTTIESEIDDLGTEETTTVIATTEPNVSPNLAIDEVKTLTINTNVSASVIDPVAEESNDIKEDGSNLENTSNDANTFPQFDIDLLNAKSLEDSIRKEVANTIEFDQRPPTALHVVDEEPAPEFRIIGQMQADDPKNIETKNGDEEVLSTTTVSPVEESNTEPLLEEEPTEDDYSNLNSLSKKKGKTSLPDEYTTVGINESTPEKASENTENTSDGVVTKKSEPVADTEDSNSGKATTTKDTSLESTVSEGTTVTNEDKNEEDSITENKTTDDKETKVRANESTSSEKNQDSSASDNTINQITKDTSLEGTATEGTTVTNKSKSDEDSSTENKTTNDKETKVGANEFTSNEKNQDSSTSDNTIINKPTSDPVVGKEDPGQEKITKNTSLEGTATEGTTITSEDKKEEDSTTENKATNDKETKVGTTKSTSSEENSLSEENKTSSNTEESIVGKPDPIDGSIGKDTTTKDSSMEITIKKETTFTKKDSSEEDTSTENKTTNDKDTKDGTNESTSSEENSSSEKTGTSSNTDGTDSKPIVSKPDPIDTTTKDVALESAVKDKDSSEEDSTTENKTSHEKETKVGTNESTSSEENSSEDSSEAKERSSTEGILNDGETLNIKDAQAVSQVHDSEAKPSNSQTNPLNADTNVGNDKRTIDSNSNIQSAFIPTTIACIGLIIGIVIAIIHLIVKRQHGTLDIELQEKRCGKDDLNEETSETHTKLLNVDLPTPTVTTALTSADKNDDCL